MTYITRISAKDDTIEIYFEKISHLLEYDIILGVLINELKCEVLASYDVVYHKCSRLRWCGIDFEFQHEDIIGNYIRTVLPYADTLEQLANQAANIINERLKK